MEQIIQTIIARREGITLTRPMLVGISGIDASGKGYIASRLAELLSTNFNVALINADGWLNLPDVRFSNLQPGKHFYENAFRFDEMFRDLVLPLKRDGRIDLTADHVGETSTAFHKYRYAYENIDVILLEGIFLFKRIYVEHFDLRIWIECSFKTALRRAVSRSQEGLDEPQTIKSYETIYFPAQRLHFTLDQPKLSAHVLFDNN